MVAVCQRYLRFVTPALTVPPVAAWVECEMLQQRNDGAVSPRRVGMALHERTGQLDLVALPETAVACGKHRIRSARYNESVGRPYFRGTTDNGRLDGLKSDHEPDEAKRTNGHISALPAWRFARATCPRLRYSPLAEKSGTLTQDRNRLSIFQFPRVLGSARQHQR